MPPPVVLQGDSRRLLEVVGGGAAGVVSSPPFEDGLPQFDRNFTAPHDSTRNLQDAIYGSTPGQLGSMPSGDYAAAVGSPPYADAVNGSGEGPGARHDPIYHNGDNAYKPSSANGYGETPGNLGSMAGEGFEAAVSSPPYGGDALGHDAGCIRLDANEDARRAAEGSYRRPGYGATNDNIGNVTGDTFWAAARQIVGQTYAALRPGGYAAWVTKRFIRKGQIVEFSDQWEALCEAVGFEPVERIAALLVEDHGDQLDIFGGMTTRRKERKSFFRRLAEKKGSPRIDHEDVIIMRRPLFRSAP